MDSIGPRSAPPRSVTFGYFYGTERARFVRPLFPANRLCRMSGQHVDPSGSGTRQNRPEYAFDGPDGGSSWVAHTTPATGRRAAPRRGGPGHVPARARCRPTGDGRIGADDFDGHVQCRAATATRCGPAAAALVGYLRAVFASQMSARTNGGRAEETSAGLQRGGCRDVNWRGPGQVVGARRRVAGRRSGWDNDGPLLRVWGGRGAKPRRSRGWPADPHAQGSFLSLPLLGLRRAGDEG